VVGGSRTMAIAILSLERWSRGRLWPDGELARSEITATLFLPHVPAKVPAAFRKWCRLPDVSRQWSELTGPLAQGQTSLSRESVRAVSGRHLFAEQLAGGGQPEELGAFINRSSISGNILVNSWSLFGLALNE
jgi:hypothetical protein